METMESLLAENRQLKAELERQKDHAEELWKAVQESLALQGKMKLRLDALEAGGGYVEANIQPQANARSNADMAELEKKYAPLFDGSSPKFNITKAGLVVKEFPELGQKLMARYMNTWGKSAGAARKPGFN